MNNSIQTTLDELTTIFNTTDEVLSEWNQPTNLQFPVLMGMIAVKLNWDDKQLREADPIVRFYVRKHPDWYVTRGAHGGIMRVADKQKKEDARLAKSTIKEIGNGFPDALARVLEMGIIAAIWNDGQCLV